MRTRVQPSTGDQQILEDLSLDIDIGSLRRADAKVERNAMTSAIVWI